MDWFLHNPLADMPGRVFAGFYALMCLGTLALCWRRLSDLDPTRSHPVPNVPTKLDPYEIAFLRGGENEVLRLRILALIQRGYLQVNEASESISQRPAHPDSRHLTQLEGIVLNFFRSEKSPDELFAPGALADQVMDASPSYDLNLRAEKLLLAKDTGWQAAKIGWLGALIIVGLGGYKLTVAMMKGYSNVQFLLLTGFGALIVLVILCKRARARESACGRSYLERLQLALARWKEQAEANTPGIEDDKLLLLAGVFGIGVLTETIYGYYPKLFKRAAANSSNDGGGSGSSCGSSCSSSSGSSCGGSSCGGGGGCGGCGGGGD